MKATEANLIAKAKKTSDFNTNLEEVMQQISHNAINGNFEITYWKTVNGLVIEHLHELGYSTEINNNNSVTIAWRL